MTPTQVFMEEMCEQSTGAIEITIPGEPHAQGRAKTAIVFGRAIIYDPKKSRNWKAMAQARMEDELRRLGHAAPYVPAGAVHLEILAVFTCPKGDRRKTRPRGRRWHTKKPDGDNVLKAVKDAAKGVLWLDDAQVVDARVIKLVGGQEEAPAIAIRLRRLEDLTE